MRMTPKLDRRALRGAGDSTPDADDARWSAVQARDPRADERFFYAVVTTGVYCRPSCAGRTARRENVRFDASSAQAERAGFRPCKRCKPEQATAAVRRASLVASLCRQIERSEGPPSLTMLARTAGLSPFH